MPKLKPVTFKFTYGYNTDYNNATRGIYEAKRQGGGHMEYAYFDKDGFNYVTEPSYTTIATPEQFVPIQSQDVGSWVPIECFKGAVVNATLSTCASISVIFNAGYVNNTSNNYEKRIKIEAKSFGPYATTQDETIHTFTQTLSTLSVTQYSIYTAVTGTISLSQKKVKWCVFSGVFERIGN